MKPNINDYVTSPNFVPALAFAFILVSSWYGWRVFSGYAYYLRTRLRFYQLRSQCVLLVAHGVADEDDEVFQFYYGLCNKFARDSRCLDFRSFIRHATEAILLNTVDAHEERFNELAKQVKQRPPEFQKLVNDFYNAIWISLLDSSTTIQVAEACRLVPRLKPLGDWLFMG
jgi:hypothetical protein